MTYIYRPIKEPNGFRVLHVYPGSGKSPVECRLEHDTLDGATAYHALSYTWGSLEETSTVLVNGCVYNVTENLLMALANLRDIDKRSTFWVDRMCINQNDINERERQVAQMREIYERAEKVDIWLGAGTKTQRDAMAAMQKLGMTIVESDLENKIRDDSCNEICSAVHRAVIDAFGEFCQANDSVLASTADSIVEFLNLPWWSRVWVKQELAVARHAEFICGSQRLSWRHAELSIATLRYLIHRRVIDPRVDQNIRFANLVIRRGHTLRLRFDVFPQKTKSLLDLVFRHARSPIAEATDPRDRIYALVGIAKNDLELAPNYTIAVDDLYCLFVKAQIRTHENDPRRLSVLSFHREGSSTKVQGLPSWAPDFTVRAGNPMAGIAIESPRRYAACGNYNMPALPASFDTDAKTLSISGISFGVAKYLGPSGTISNGVFPLNDQETFRQCQKLCWEVNDFAIRISSSMCDRRLDNYDETHITAQIWRTIVEDVGFVTHTAQRSRATKQMEHMYKVLQGTEEPPSDFMATETSETARCIAYTRRYVQEIRSRIHKRRVFMTESGDLAIGPESLRVGDALCVLMGAEVPFALRETEPGRYVLIGETYVHGYMDGEVLSKGLEMCEFQLV